MRSLDLGGVIYRQIMSPRRKNNRSKKSKVVVSHSDLKSPSDYTQLARAVVVLAKDMHEAKSLGISVEELHKRKWSADDKN